MLSHDAPTLSPNPRVRIEADDPRADNRRRVIDIAREAVVIRRSVASVAMTIRAPSSVYRGVALRLAKLCGERVRWEAWLEHRDPDLSVLLAQGEDKAVIEGRWRDWAGFFRLPALVERIDAATQAASLEVAGIARRLPCVRRAPRRRRRAGRAFSPGAKSAFLHSPRWPTPIPRCSPDRILIVDRSSPRAPRAAREPPGAGAAIAPILLE